eukprot:8853837-Pyramimonas_sp.AAC.1
MRCSHLGSGVLRRGTVLRSSAPPGAEALAGLPGGPAQRRAALGMSRLLPGAKSNTKRAGGGSAEPPWKKASKATKQAPPQEPSVQNP